MRKRAQGKFIRAHKLRRSEAYLGARRRNKDEDLRVMRFAKTGLFSLMLPSPSSPSSIPASDDRCCTDDPQACSRGRRPQPGLIGRYIFITRKFSFEPDIHTPFSAFFCSFKSLPWLVCWLSNQVKF